MAGGKEQEEQFSLANQQAPDTQLEGQILTGTNRDKPETKVSENSSAEGKKDTGKEAEAATNHETQQQEAEIASQAEKEKLNQETENALNRVKESIDDKLAQIEIDLAKAEKDKAENHEITTTIKGLTAQMNNIKQEIAKNPTQEVNYKAQIDLLDAKIMTLSSGLNNRQMQEGENLRNRSARQASLVLDGQEWKNNRKTNTIRAASGLALVGGAIRGAKKIRKGIKSLFGSSEVEEKPQTTEEKEGGFRNTRTGKIVSKFGNVAKRAIITIVGVKVGSRLRDKFVEKKSDDIVDGEKPPAEAIQDAYENLSDKEKDFYNKEGTVVNEMRKKSILKVEEDHMSELVIGTDKETGQEVRITTGKCLAAIDACHASVGDFLYMKSNNLESFLTAFDPLGWAGDKIGEVFTGMQDKLTDSAVGGFCYSLYGKVFPSAFTDGKPNEEFSRLLSSNIDMQTQMNHTFQTYLRIRQFIHQKTLILERKLIAENLGLTDINDPQIEEKLSDETFMASIIQPQIDTALKKKWSGFVETLEKYSINDETIDPSIQEEINEIAHDKDDNYPEIKTLASGTEVSEEDKETIDTYYETLSKDINDPIYQKTFVCSMLGGVTRGMDWFFNMSEDDKKQVADRLGYPDIMAELTKSINEIPKEQRYTAENRKKLQKVIDTTYGIRTEIALGGKLENRRDGKRKRYSFDMFSFGVVMVGGIWTLKIGIGVAKKLNVVTKAIGINRLVGKGMKIPGKTAKGIVNGVGRLTGRSWAFTGPKAQEAFYKSIDKGNISLKQIEKTFYRQKRLGTARYASFNDFVKQGIFGDPNIGYDLKKLTMLYDGSKVQRRLLLQGGAQAKQAYQSFESFAASNMDLLTKKQPPRLHALYTSIINNTGITDYGKLSTILKNADEYINLVDKTGYKTLQQAISKNAQALLSGATTIDDVLKNSDMGELLDLKTIQKSIISDASTALTKTSRNIKALEQEIDDLTKLGKTSSGITLNGQAQTDAIAAKQAEKTFAENALKNTTQLEKTIASGGDMKYIKQLEKLLAKGMSIDTVADIHAIIKAQPDKADDIIRSLEKGIAGNRDDFRRLIPSTIKLGKSIDDITASLKSICKNSDEMVDGLKATIKGLAKVLAAIT